MKIILAVLVIFCFYFPSSFAETPINVTTQFGTIIGEIETMSGGFQMKTFRSVPYAQSPPPRFARPLSLAKLRVNPYDAIDFKPDCARLAKDGKTMDPSSSEDCLYLKILAPATGPGSLPVMFWIQSGGFNDGSTTDFDLDALATNFLSKGVVMVLVNHRQGPFGFFTTGTADAPGNWGVWDALEALKFVHNNIKVFGGNPDQITIMGHESGSVMAELLSLSPLARGLYSSVIMMGGSVFDPNIIKNDHVNDIRGHDLAMLVGCDSTSLNLWNTGKRNQVLQCLQKNVTTEKLTMAVTRPQIMQHYKGCLKCNYYWRPRKDDLKGVLPLNFETLAQQRPMTPFIIGVMHRDWLADLFPFIYDGTEKLPADFDKTYNVPAFSVKTCQNLLGIELYTAPVLANLTKQCIDHFVNHSKPDEPNYWAHRAGTIATTYHVTAPIYKTTGFMKKQNNWHLYVYSFEYNRKELGPYWEATGASRYLDLTLLTNYNPTFPFNKKDRDEAGLFSDMLVNFAKFQNPTPLTWKKLNVQWETFGAENEFLIYNSAMDSKVEEHEKESDSMFWVNSKALDEDLI